MFEMRKKGRWVNIAREMAALLAVATISAGAFGDAAPGVIHRDLLSFDRASLMRDDGLPSPKEKAARLVESSGWVEFDVNIPATGWYELWFKGMPLTWVRDVIVDGQVVLQDSVAAVEDSDGPANNPDASFKEGNLYLTAGKHALRIRRTMFPGKFPAAWELRPGQGKTEASARVAAVDDPIVEPGKEIHLKILGGRAAEATRYELALRSCVDAAEVPVGTIEFPAVEKPVEKDVVIHADRPGAYVLVARSNGQTLRPADLKCGPIIVSKSVGAQSEKGPVVPTSLAVASVYGDGMVIQRDVPMPVWGWAPPGTQVSVQLAGQSKSATADAKGDWTVTFEPVKTGGPYEMAVSGGGKKISYKNILAGEVWMMSGQSNMGGTLKDAFGGHEALESAKFPDVRLAKLAAKNATADDAREVYCPWQSADLGVTIDRKSLITWNAIPFAFGVEVNKRLKVPVGMLLNNRGGTFIATWTSLQAQAGEPGFAPMLEKWKQDTQGNSVHMRVAARVVAEIRSAAGRVAKEKDPKIAEKIAHVDIDATVARLIFDQYRNEPACLYESLVRPLAPFPVRGVVWYQGESDSPRSNTYPALLKTFVKDWRQTFQNPNLAFVVVQIAYGSGAPYKGEPGDSRFGEMQEAQASILSVPHTSIVNTYDLPRPADNVHYLDKLPVGYRAALAALHDEYGMREIQPGGPKFESMMVQGSQVRLKFSQVSGGLKVKGDSLKGFAVAGDDRVFHWAHAHIDGQDVVLTCDQVQKPVAVRYGWTNSPCGANLYGGNDLPAFIFRTDHWPMLSEMRVDEVR